MAFPFAASPVVMEAPSRPTVFMGREIAVDRDELPDFNFDAVPEPDFSDSDPDNEIDDLRAFNQVVLADAQAAGKDGSDEGSEAGTVTADAVDLLKQHNAAAQLEQSSESVDSDIGHAPEPEIEDGAMADEEDEVAPASPVRSPKKPAKALAKMPVKAVTKAKPAKPSKPVAKSPTKAPAKLPAKPATAKKTRKPKKELPAERPTRVSDRVSKPPTRAAAQAATKPKPAAAKPNGVRKKTGPKPANNRKTTGQQWEIESIVGSMIDDTHQHFYQVKWKGYPTKDNTWEPKINLANCQAAIRAFEGVKGKRGRPPGRKSSS